MNGKMMALGLASVLFSSAAISYAGNPASKWTVPTLGPVSGSPAAAANGSVIYVTSEDGNLYALNMADGSQNVPAINVHNVPTAYDGGITADGEFIASPAIACDGTIYVASSDQNLYSINPRGTINWAWPLTQNNAVLVGAAAIGGNGVIYVTYDDDSHLYAVNSQHTVLWTLDLSTVFNNVGVGVDSPPVVGPDGTIYLYACSYAMNDYLVAIHDNGNSASVKWLVNLGFDEDQNDFRSSMALDNNGRIYVPYSLGSPGSICLQAFKTSDGAPVWSVPFSTPSGAAIRTTPALGTNGTIYVGADDGVLYAITSNGTLKWSFDTLTMIRIRSSPTVASDGTVIFGAANGLYSVKDNTTTGQLNWTVPLAKEVDSSPLIAGSDNAIYFGGSDGNVYAVTGSAPLAVSAWPMFCKNIERTSSSGPGITVNVQPDNFPPYLYKAYQNSISFSLTASQPFPVQQTVYFYIGGDGTDDGTGGPCYATYPTDFSVTGAGTIPIPNGFQVVFPAGASSATFTVTAINSPTDCTVGGFQPLYITVPNFGGCAYSPGSSAQYIAREYPSVQ